MGPSMHHYMGISDPGGNRALVQLHSYSDVSIGPE